MERSEEIRKHIYVSGRVQGVGFRFRTQYLARGFGLTGWVRNLDDGRVEMELQGPEEAMNLLFEHLRQDRFIVIDDFQAELIPTVEESGFRVRS
ncbi:acylphosphatase [Clostridium sp. Marseille-P2415]|uniref:acylphosphatase n=1 Tax=Clostridium sp. Marseille-P2415 TaxID=1805471 RepID=UPI000988492E|nr:acylphosphatase [Clostridium sp. Marseille-P2415]